jgi:hypothetical protein
MTDVKYCTDAVPPPWNEWDDDEEAGPADLEDRLEAALDRAFPRPVPRIPGSQE